MQLTTNTTIDALDGDGFNFGRNLTRSLNGALINSAIDGAAAAAIELKERQLSRKAANSTRVITEPVSNEYSNLPEIGPVNNRITTNVPNLELQKATGTIAPSQLHKNIDMRNRMMRRGSQYRGRSIIIRGTDGRSTIINIPPLWEN